MPGQLFRWMLVQALWQPRSGLDSDADRRAPMIEA